MTNWNRRKVLVTGGAGFIGSNLVDALLTKGADVAVVDNLLIPSQQDVWEKKVSRLHEIYGKHDSYPKTYIIDLALDKERFQLLAEDYDIVFHLSAVFGGREFVDTKQAECSAMLAIDHNVIDASYQAGVRHVHYASSACVYPPWMQYPNSSPLKEDDVCHYDGNEIGALNWFDLSDNLYGWAKLMGELQLKRYYKEKGLHASICRYLTVYGWGEFDASHAISALIKKAMLKEDPYVVWGSGEQERGFTYVSDIVNGSILASEKIRDAVPINLGTDKRYKIKDVAGKILLKTGHLPYKVSFDTSKPEGPRSRGLDITRAKQMLGWNPEVDLDEGLTLAVEWHKSLTSLR